MNNLPKIANTSSLSQNSSIDVLQSRCHPTAQCVVTRHTKNVVFFLIQKIIDLNSNTEPITYIV